MTVVNIAIQRISHDGILKQENNHDFKQWDSHDREVGYVSSKICHSKYDHEPAFWYVCTFDAILNDSTKQELNNIYTP
jgi:hypothetical protein